MSIRIIAFALAVTGCGPTTATPPAAPTEHRIATICNALEPVRAPRAPSSKLQEMQDANYALSQCMLRNALAFAEERESAETVGKAVADACSSESMLAQVADQVAFYAPNHQTTEGEMNEYQRRLDREGMTDVVRVRAGHCAQPD